MAAAFVSDVAVQDGALRFNALRVSEQTDQGRTRRRWLSHSGGLFNMMNWKQWPWSNRETRDSSYTDTLIRHDCESNKRGDVGKACGHGRAGSVRGSSGFGASLLRRSRVRTCSGAPWVRPCFPMRRGR